MLWDIARVRAQYPALREGYAHFDGAAGTLVAARSAQAIAGVTGAAVANTSSDFEAGRRSLRIMAEARRAVADLVGGQPAGVVFGPSTTALTYRVARTLAAGWGPGDEVVASQLDHDANVRPWVQLATRAGATVRWAEVDPTTGELSTQQYGHLVTGHTKLVAVTAAANSIGTRPDVAAIARTAHDAGALLYVDGVHATPHAPIDMAELGADFYVTSAYKWSGPHMAACVAGPARWETLHPDKLVPAPDSVPERFELGTLSFELLAGMTGAVDHLADLIDTGGTDSSGDASIGTDRTGTDPTDTGGDASGGGTPPSPRRERLLASMAAAQSYEMELFHTLIEGLSQVPGLMMQPAPADRCPTVAFRVGDHDPAHIAQALDAEGVCVFAGNNYAHEYFERVGLNARGGAVRASIYHYNTVEDVARLLDALKRLP